MVHTWRSVELLLLGVIRLHRGLPMLAGSFLSRVMSLEFSGSRSRSERFDCRLAENMITLLSCAFAFSGHFSGLPLAAEAATACSILQAAGSLILRRPYCVLLTEFVIVLPCIALNMPGLAPLSISSSAAAYMFTPTASMLSRIRIEASPQVRRLNRLVRSPWPVETSK